MTQPVAAVSLPGILMPAAARYGPLRAEIGDARRTLAKELDYAGAEPPPAYSMQTEIDGLDHFANEHGLDRFHLYGHSAGAAIALEYVAEHPGRVVSLAIDEPASDFSEEDRRALAAALPADFDDLPVPERMASFARALLRPGVEPPALPPPSGDPEMAKRPAGLVAFRRALEAYTPEGEAPRVFEGPVYYSYGSLSHERWEAMAERLQRDVLRCTVERYDGIHHLNTSHQAEPGRVAAALDRLWREAETGQRDR